MAVKHILIVRHGETDYNVTRRWQGWLPTHLNATGYAQAQALARYFQAHPVGAIYSSDLRRAQDTVRPIADQHSLPIHTDERLREIHVGIFQGLSHAQVIESYPTEMQRWQADWDYAVPEGESRHQQQARAYAAFQDIVAQSTAERTLIMTHGGILRTLLLYLFPQQHQLRDTHLPNASITTLDCSDFTPRLLELGATAHLTDNES